MRVLDDNLASSHHITSKYGGPVAFSMLEYKRSDWQSDEPTESGGQFAFGC